MKKVKNMMEKGEMHNAAPKNDNICAVIVTYNPDLHFPERVSHILQQVDRAVIVDNHSERYAVEMLQHLSPHPKIHLIFNDENLGIASALNNGIHEAQEAGYTWALLFDHDTDPMDFMVETLSMVYRNFLQQDRLAVIGSNYYNVKDHEAKYRFPPSKELSWVEQDTVITSGSLISLPAFQVIGGFREEFFIDLVDMEYCLKARAKGFRVLMTCKPIVRHALGDVTMHKILWRGVGVSNHPALRQYYMTRNYILLAREYMFKDLRWVLATLWSRIKALVALIIFEDDRMHKMYHVFLGFWHGVIGRSGRL